MTSLKALAPIFQRRPIFMAFAIADALSVLSSSLTILMFLGILTSRYACRRGLPQIATSSIAGGPKYTFLLDSLHDGGLHINFLHPF